MSGDKVVTIEPESANVTLKQKGKNDKSASISQEQTEFSTDDFKNKTRTNGAVTADSLTAGSWNGTFNFNISYQQVQYSYYSSIELAANDANNMTTANADVSEDNFDDAVAALLVKDNKASIKMLKDESNVDNVTLSQDTSINLGTHTVTFAEGKYLTANNNLLIDNGKISTTNSEYAVYTNSQDSSFTMNNVTIKEELSSEIPEFCEKLSDKNAYLVFNKDVNIGLFNEWSGTCGYPDNYLERDFVVPTTMVRNVQIEGAKPIGKERAEELRNIYKNTDSEYAKQRAWQNLETEGVSGYTIDNVCGMVGDFWKSNAVSYTDTAPILVNEDIETTLNEIEQANKEKNEEIER